jgi:hypothetical protein
MKYKTTLVFLCAVLPGFAEDYVMPQPETTRTEHFDFAPGGTIRFEGSYGDLIVEGWDQPEVEITVTKSIRYKYKSAESPEAAKRIASLEVVSERRLPTELLISTKLAARQNGKSVSPPMVSSTKVGVLLEYALHIPRNSRLVIHHGSGEILIRDVSGEIDASCSMGEMTVWISGSGTYAIDARSRTGTILSEFGGSKRSHYLFGQTFTSESSTPSQRLRLRVGYGNITIEPILPESEAPAARR